MKVVIKIRGQSLMTMADAKQSENKIRRDTCVYCGGVGVWTVIIRGLLLSNLFDPVNMMVSYCSVHRADAKTYWDMKCAEQPGCITWD